MIFSANRRPLRRIMRYQILASARLFPKFVSELAAMYHELRKPGTSTGTLVGRRLAVRSMNTISSVASR
jgi:hypothetical protein